MVRHLVQHQRQRTTEVEDMKLIWVLLLLTATVVLVRADEEEQELVDVEDTEIEEITEDELEAEDLEDPRKQHRKGRRPFPVGYFCKHALSFLWGRIAYDRSLMHNCVILCSFWVHFKE